MAVVKYWFPTAISLALLLALPGVVRSETDAHPAERAQPQAALQGTPAGDLAARLQALEEDLKDDPCPGSCRRYVENLKPSAFPFVLSGNIMVDARTSPNSLYDAEIATMEGGGSYNQDDAEGFLRIHGLPSRVQGTVTPRNY